jgi:hypothetical protein
VPKQQTSEYATPEDVQAAIEALSDADSVRLYKFASLRILGTEYKDPWHLINEVIKRTMEAAVGNEGRRWPKSRVGFLAFLLETMKGLESDSRETVWVTRSQSLERALTEDGTAVRTDFRSRSAEEEALDSEEQDAEDARVCQATDVIEKHFKHDEEVSLLLECLKEEMIGTEIMETCGFRDMKHYETVRHRMRRHIEKLFPEGRPA